MRFLNLFEEYILHIKGRGEIQLDFKKETLCMVNSTNVKYIKDYVEIPLHNYSKQKLEDLAARMVISAYFHKDFNPKYCELFHIIKPKIRLVTKSPNCLHGLIILNENSI